MRAFAGRWGRAVLDVLLPPLCARCGADTGDGDASAGAPGHAGLCAACARRADALAAALCEPPPPRPLAAWRAGGAYQGAERLWMRRFKYPEPGLRGIDPAAELVVRALAVAAARRMPGGPPQAVLAIPAQAARGRRRGFVPALLLARAVADEAGAPLLAGALRRVRETPSQTGLDAAARRRNVAGAFTAARALPRHVWIVDDLFTTGATLAEAARAARRGGARRVGGVAALWTPPASGRP